MTHTVNTGGSNAAKTTKENISTGQLTLNAQVAVGGPNPTLLEQMSKGALRLDQMTSGVTLNGNFGGE